MIFFRGLGYAFLASGLLNVAAVNLKYPQRHLQRRNPTLLIPSHVENNAVDEIYRKLREERVGIYELDDIFHYKMAKAGQLWTNMHIHMAEGQGLKEKGHAVEREGHLVAAEHYRLEVSHHRKMEQVFRKFAGDGTIPFTELTPEDRTEFLWVYLKEQKLHYERIRRYQLAAFNEEQRADMAARCIDFQNVIDKGKESVSEEEILEVVEVYGIIPVVKAVDVLKAQHNGVSEPQRALARQRVERKNRTETSETKQRIEQIREEHKDYRKGLKKKSSAISLRKQALQNIQKAKGITEDPVEGSSGTAGGSSSST